MCCEREGRDREYQKHEGAVSMVDGDTTQMVLGEGDRVTRVTGLRGCQGYEGDRVTRVPGLRGCQGYEGDRVSTETQAMHTQGLYSPLRSPGLLREAFFPKPQHTHTHTHTSLIVYRYACTGFPCVYRSHSARLLIQKDSGLPGYSSMERLTDVRILSATVVMKGDRDVHQQVSDKEDVESAMQKHTITFYRVSFYIVNKNKCGCITHLTPKKTLIGELTRTYSQLGLCVTVYVWDGRFP